MRDKTLPRAGFTLVEFAVTIGVVAVLVSLGLFGLSAARSRARQAVCISNLEQLDKAFLMYASDHDNILPPYQNSIFPSVNTVSGHYPVSAPAGFQLVGSLQPYVGSKAIWFCPEDPFAHTHTAGLMIDHSSTSYTVSIFLGVEGHPATTEGTRIIPFEVPTTNLVLLSDDDMQKGLGGCHPEYSHNGSFNYLMFDGHVCVSKPDCPQ